MKFSKTHEWVKVDGNVATIGLTDYAQDQLGEIVYAEAEPEGTVVELEGIIGTVESVKAASDLMRRSAAKLSNRTKRSKAHLN